MDDMPLRPARIVTVLGMHRSGTSALTRILDLLGATLGPDDALIPPAPDNPRGFWENRPLVLVNDRILALHGGSWAAPPDLSVGWQERPTMRALHTAAGEVFDRLVSGPSQVVVWKDPRSCLLQDFWQPLLRQRTDDLRYIHVLRSPDAVVGSLVRRNDLTPEHAARLWVRYVTDALRTAPTALLLDESALHADLQGTISTVAEEMGLPQPSGDTWDAIIDFVDPDLRRSSGFRAPDGPWIRCARTLHDGFLAGAGPHQLLARLTTPSTNAPRPTGPALAVLGSRSIPAAIVGSRVQEGARVASVLAPSPEVRYALGANGWPLVELPPVELVGRMRPERILCTDDDVLLPTLNEVIARRPNTRVLVTDESALRPVADGVVPLDDTDDALRMVASAPVPRQGTQQIGDVPARTTTPGLVSVVIPVHGAWSLTDACLARLATTSSGYDVEVVVVDDASPDETPERLRHDPRVDHVITCPTNLGFAGAVNAGLRATTGEYVCVLNNDTEVVDGWLAPLIAALELPHTGLAGPRTNRISGPQAIADAPGFDQLGSAGLHEWARAWRSTRPDVHWATGRLVGFCLAARRTLFEQLGGFDEGVGRGNFEDDELCARVRGAGLACRVAEQSLVLHHGSATFGVDRASYLRTLLDGARHTAGRLRHDPPVAMAVVLGGTDMEAAVRTAVTALPVTEAAEIWHPAPLPDGMVLPQGVRTRQVAWDDDEQVLEAAAALTCPRLLVLGEGETLVTEDHVVARHALESTDATGIDGPGEVRAVANTPAQLLTVGDPTNRAVPGLHVRVPATITAP